MLPADIMEQMRKAFRAESLDLLIELDSALLALESEPGQMDLVHRVFRAVHTIKGSGATAGCVHLARFAHGMEGAFALAREGRLSVTPELIDSGLKACDVLRLIMDESAEGPPVPGEVEVSSSFARMLPSTADAQSVARKPGTEKPPSRSAFEIVFKPRREMFYSGSDPANLLDDLRALGQAHITAHLDQLPALPALEPEHCYLWWDILLVTDRDEAAIKEVFVFVEDECELQITLREDQGEAVALLGSVPAEMFELFLIECEEHLADIERDALALESAPESRVYLDALFRSVHSIKGNAALLLQHAGGAALLPAHPLQVMLRVAHGLESLLDPFREPSAGPIGEDVIRTTLETRDAIAALAESLTHDKPAPIPPALLSRLGVPVTSLPTRPQLDGREAAFLNTTSQCVETIAACFRRLDEGDDPAASILAIYLRSLKTLSAAARYRVCPQLDEPLARQLRIVEAALEPGAELKTEDRVMLAESFALVCSLLEGLAGAPEIIAPAVAAAAPDWDGEDRRESPVDAPADRRAAVAPPSTIRIDQSKLDRLMTIVGELLVARGAFPLLIQKLNDEVKGTAVVKDLKDAESNISRISDELQSSVMSIRMLPVKTVFQRFPRLVRDLSRSLGKEVRMVVEGEGIELDKTIVEQIGDPLVHVIRNAVDHGLEMPEARLAAGKDTSGLLTLRAHHEAGGVSIEVSDDGRGLNAAALKIKAVEKGLITSEAADAMSEEAAYQLVFLPGLSTAAKLTDVSGRGVGMDVVQSNVRNLHGTIEIRSKLGRGTTFLIKLPTSLMVSKGILLHAGGQEYILPLSCIRDMVKLPSSEAHQYQGQTIAQVRGSIYSIFDLAEMLGLQSIKAAQLAIAIVETGNIRYGLLVDKFLTEVEVLVKPLTGGLEQAKEFQGAAIMGDGRVVLVLNALECHNQHGVACA